MSNKTKSQQIGLKDSELSSVAGELIVIEDEETYHKKHNFYHNWMTFHVVLFIFFIFLLVFLVAFQVQWLNYILLVILMEVVMINGTIALLIPILKWIIHRSMNFSIMVLLEL